LWAATAPAAPALPSLDGRHVADVLIIGAGFTGLSAAIRLCREGRRVIVLDAAEPGWGASGRNNGQVIAGLKQDPEVIETLYPGEAGRRLVRFGSEAPGVVFRLIDEFGIDCAAGNKGWIQPAFTGSGLRGNGLFGQPVHRRGRVDPAIHKGETVTDQGQDRPDLRAVRSDPIGRDGRHSEASGRKSWGMLSCPSSTSSAITWATLGAMPKPILKPPLAMNWSG